MKKIEWLGGIRYIPPYGMIDSGDERDLPDDKADSYVKQGLAKLVKPKTTRKAVEEDS